MEAFNNIQFAQIEWLYAIPGITVIILFYVVKTKQALPPMNQWLLGFSQFVFRHPMANLFSPSTKASKAKLTIYLFLSTFTYLVLVILMSISLAQPYRVGRIIPEPPQHRDIVLLVDTSVSMILRDYLVNAKRTPRIEVLKNVLSHFIDQLEGNRIQIIAYSEQAYTVAPLTTDYALLKYQIQRLEPASLTGRSSDLSQALLYALQQFQSTSPSSDNKPVFVMLTDANRPVRKIDPKVAAEYVAEQGIRLHTIAIGAGSYEAEEKQQASLVYHPTSFYLLEQIAKTGNGYFFWAKDSSSLTNALSAVNEAEKRNINVEPQFVKHPLYHWPLLLALGILLLSYSIAFLRGLTPI